MIREGIEIFKLRFIESNYSPNSYLQYTKKSDCIMDLD